jgi:23S rRNA (uracil1939-C5)-methyltransferase
MVPPMRVAIRSLAHGGDGVGMPEDGGATWFVPGALPGEVVEAQAEHVARKFVRGRLLRVLRPAELRVEPPCRHVAEGCGGCSWQHVEASRQPEHKRRIVADQLRALVPGEDFVRLGESPPRALGYRRRARLHYERQATGELELGVYRTGSHRVLDLPSCPVLVPALDVAVQRLRGAGSVLPAKGEVLGLTDGESVVLGLPGVRPEPATIAALEGLLAPPLVGIVLRGGRQSHTIGRGRLAIDGGGGLPPVLASPFAFAQANAVVDRAVVRHVALAARCEGARVLELYSGAGNFTRALAPFAKRVWAVDEDRESITLLRALAKAEDLPINAKKSSAPVLLGKIAAGSTRYDVVVLDPPRKGIGETAAAALATVAERRIVYVSCDPATLARDLKVLVREGFALTSVVVFDMMPMTPEVEVVVTLERRGAKTR